MSPRTKLSASLALAFGAAAWAPAGSAQTVQSFDRVEVTGSAVRRIDAENALPVQVFRRADIERSGATSVSEFIQSLPSMQNFTNEAASVGGGGNGFSGASVHGIGEERTLVLLNGRRLAAFAGQFVTGALAGIDLNTIPLAAIERVEVLTDGASALYGADAIAGVVNFITRRDLTSGSFEAGYTAPRGGAREQRLSFTKGFGQLDGDGFNLSLGASYEKRDALASTKRDFARTGVLDVEIDGRPAIFFNGSPRTIPGNITHNNDTPGDPNDDFLVNPFLAANGVCPPQHVVDGDACAYDFTADLEILPERERAALFLRGDLKLGAGHTGFAELLLSRTENTNRLAPSPGEILVTDTSPFWGEVLAVNPGAVGSTVVPYRLSGAGRRTQTDETEARHLVLGSAGLLGAWDYNVSFTHSINQQKTFLRDGITARNATVAVLESGLLNPFATLDSLSPEALQALRDARILGFWEGGESTLDVLELRGTRELAQLPGGALAFATGLSYTREKFDKTATALAQGGADGRFGDDAGVVPYSADRNSRGAFAELVAPVAKGVELGAALRWDDYADFGSTTTGKLTARYQPTQHLLLRGSLGTGFKAPTVPQVNATRQDFGVTSFGYECDAALIAIAAELGAVCPAGGVQFDVLAQGNSALQPETSRQWSIGLRFEPSDDWSFGADLWNVRIRDAIGQIDESEIFNDPERYRDEFTSSVDPVTLENRLAILLRNNNLGEETRRGIDFDVRARLSTPLGRLSTQLAVTRVLKDRYQFERGGESFSSLGRYGENTDVVFKWQGRFNAVLDAGAFTHSLALNFRSGYSDATYVADDFVVFDPNTFEGFDYNGRVKRYHTLDWQTAWRVTPSFKVTGGVLNVFDRDPPRSLRIIGGGQALGYDDRYYDPRGRTLYLAAGLSF